MLWMSYYKQHIHPLRCNSIIDSFFLKWYKDFLLEIPEGKSGGMAEWSKAAVLKTVELTLRGFESYLLRHFT